MRGGEVYVLEVLCKSGPGAVVGRGTHTEEGVLTILLDESMWGDSGTAAGHGEKVYVGRGRKME